MREESPEPDNARYVEVAKRFLHTAVVVDDEARLQFEQPARLETPDRRNRPDTPNDAGAEPARSLSLDAATLSKAFAEYGVVCGVLVPESHAPMTDTVVRAAARADIVILDWTLGDDDGQEALSIFNALRDHDDKHGERIRLVVVYTGESNLRDILQRIRDAMPADTEVEATSLRLRQGNCRVMIFGKNPEQLPPDDQAFACEEGELPAALIERWVSMDAGVLPSLALLSLSAVRENAHAVLAKFRRDLDPAFMTHRACLPIPEDAEQHVVDQVASELRAVMAERLRAGSHGHRDALNARVRDLWGAKQLFKVNDEEVTASDAAKAVVGGEAAAKTLLSASAITDEHVRKLTPVFAGGQVTKKAAKALDLEFSWLMTARTVRGGEPRALRLGVVVEEDRGSEDPNMLLCLMPRCDSVRVKGFTRFLFAPLRAPDSSGPQLVVRQNHQYIRKGVGSKTGDWEQIPFDASTDGRVVAKEADDSWWFTASESGNARRFRWLGELRPEWAQHLSHTLGTRLTRVAANTPEWLRRQERS